MDMQHTQEINRLTKEFTAQAKEIAELKESQATERDNYNREMNAMKDRMLEQERRIQQLNAAKQGMV